jgi:hypothetical protein
MWGDSNRYQAAETPLSLTLGLDQLVDLSTGKASNDLLCELEALRLATSVSVSVSVGGGSKASSQAHVPVGVLVLLVGPHGRERRGAGNELMAWVHPLAAIRVTPPCTSIVRDCGCTVASTRAGASAIASARASTRGEPATCHHGRRRLQSQPRSQPQPQPQPQPRPTPRLASPRVRSTLLDPLNLASCSGGVFWNCSYARRYELRRVSARCSSHSHSHAITMSSPIASR